MAAPSALHRDDALPLYQQIFLALRDEILSGRRPLGENLPTEHDLSALYGVSRITARRALDELAGHGLVERRRRIGTRVIFRAPATPIEANIDQAIESLIAFGRDTQVRVVALAEEPAADHIAPRLGLAPGAATLRALRVRYLDDAPLGAIESHVPLHLAAGLTRERLTETPLLEILRESGHAIGGGTQTIAAIAADPARAALLGTEPRAPLIRIERVVHDLAGKPLLLTIAEYRGDRYRLALDLHGAARPAAD
uniref:GntR family transcriptional regulator n=1 Tax=uncultured Sphingomonas sp. TaxID=158754 RepID=UPI0035C95C83